MRALTTILVLVGVALLAASPAQAAPCGDAVVRDWTDGKISGRYAPRCYGDALETLPEDVRAYSTAEEDISAALRARIRETRGPAQAGGGEGPSGATFAVPVPLLSAAGVALLLGLAGVVHLVVRRLRHDRMTQRSPRPIGQW
jgi:hypothetical protein